MKRDIHHLFYLGLLTVFVIFLPTSKYMTSLVQILIFIHWLLRGNLIQRISKIRQMPMVWVISLLFLAHLVGMLYTKDIDYGLHDLKIKLPLLVLPVIIATSEQLKFKEIKFILLFFVAAVIAASLANLSALFGLFGINVRDFREASLFISHIRFSLLVALSIYFLTFYALRHDTPIRQKITFWGLAGYLVAFLVVSKSLTGIIIALVVGIVLALRWILQQSGLMGRWFAIVGVMTIPVLVSAYIGSKFNDFYTVKDDLDNLQTHTVNGNLYWHDTTNLDRENGYFVGLYWCEEELRKGWNQISDLPYDQQDEFGQDVKYTLIRYLTSMGLRKDSFALTKLTPEDIDLIEQGFANVNYRNKNRFHNRIYKIIWQLDVYRRGGNPSGHSITQRLEFLKTGWAIFKDQPWTGVGTGDVPDAFAAKYTSMNTQLAPEWQLRAHNQWLTFAIALGIPGFGIMLLVFFLPGLYLRRFKHYLFLLFMMVALLSMLNEDTLETQAGVAFVAFFYPLFLFSKINENEREKTS